MTKPTAVSVIAVAAVGGAIWAHNTGNDMLASSIVTLGITLATVLGGRNNGSGAAPK